MPKFIQEISFGTILTLISVVAAISIAWGKIEYTTAEFKTTRNEDLKRVEKVEISHEVIKERISNIEKTTAILHTDISYIKSGIEEIKQALKGK